MNQESLMKAVNVRETVKMYAIYLGIYDEFVRAYVMTGEGMCRHYCNPGLHESFERKVMPELQELCGGQWGENPRSPLHPVGKLLLRKNKLL